MTRTATHCSMRAVFYFSLALALVLWPEVSAAQVPGQWVFSGALSDGDEVVADLVDIEVALYARASGGEARFTELHRGVSVEDGFFTIEIGAVEAITAELLDGEPLWLSLTVDGDALEPRLPIGSVPYAHRAARADQADNSDGLFVGETEIVDSEGTWVGPDIPAEVVDLGDFTANELARTIDDLEDRIEALETANTELAAQLLALQRSLDAGVARVSTLEASVGPLSTLTEGMRRVGDDLFFEGRNVYIQSGEGSTYHSASLDVPGDPNGLGNLIVGYNEIDGRADGTTRGSHNVIVGPGNEYDGFGGLVVGRRSRIDGVGAFGHGFMNTASGAFSAALAGSGNLSDGTASAAIGGTSAVVRGERSVAIGGGENTTSGFATDAVVIGGESNEASAELAVALGGTLNEAESVLSVALGGQSNVTSASGSVVVGGAGNDAGGENGLVLGGQENATRATNSVVLGGRNNSSQGQWSVILGGGGGSVSDGNTASGDYATVVGGLAGLASGPNSLVAGGNTGTASGTASSVFGGRTNNASAETSTVVGGNLNVAGGRHGAVLGGRNNEVTSEAGTIVGGSDNQTCGLRSTVVGAVGQRDTTNDALCAPETACSPAGALCD